MAYHPTQSSKLQSTKSFHRIISSATNSSSSHQSSFSSSSKTSQIQKLCQSKDALDALVHLSSSSSVSAEIAQQAMLSWRLLCQIQERDTLQYLVIDYEILPFLSRQLMHFDIEVKISAAKCVGELAKWAFTCRRLVQDKVLQPLCALIRPKQDWKLLQAACFALSMIYSFSEMMNRVIIVWGMSPLKEMIERLLVHINKEIAKRQQMSITERRIKDNQRSPSIDLLCASVRVWENFSKYQKLAIKMEAEGILDQLEKLLQFDADNSIRIEASKTILNLTQHKPLRSAIMKKESVLLSFFSRSQDSNFEVKHSVAKAMDSILTNCSPKEQDHFHKLIIREATIPFIDWMLKTVNCNNILAIALEALTAHNSQFISTQNQDAFGSDVFRMLMARLKSSVDVTVKHMCAEALYCFAAVPCFRDEIMRAQAAEMLVYMLSSKEPLFQTFAVKTLAQLCDSSNRTSRFIDLGLAQAALKQYVSSSSVPVGGGSSARSREKTSAHDMEYLLNATIILYALSEFSDFRNLFAGHPRALNRFLYIFDHTSHKELLTFSLRIMLRLTSMANKEGAGNGNLKVMTEKRLNRILGFLAPPNLPDSKFQQLILDLIKSFLPHRNIPMDSNGKSCFWEISLTEILKLVPPKDVDDRLAHETHKAHLMKFVQSLVCHNHVVSDVNWDSLLHGLMNVLVKSPPLSEARLYCVKSLSTLKNQREETFTIFLNSHFDYCKQLNLGINSNNELLPKFSHFLQDFMDNFSERRVMTQKKSKDAISMLKRTLMKGPSTFSEKIRGNMSGIRKFYNDEHDHRVQETVRKRRIRQEQEEREKNKYALLSEWKAQFNEEVPGNEPSLIDIAPTTVKLRVNYKTLKGDLDPKFEKRMKRKIQEFERLQGR
eukprot:CAMPEP_0117435866 /NCGR_PEP_ID=MMETSP0759-20121206/707_1 /TAXON_ID=63605 /ORGANISM="Percolomonas cosmopolitus, Strain WS" /LENGTH=886 /DNA_ID=CAMNT_0005227437 /DNA_START=5 /DNA_END=2665 /DNA_ORIENTATION=+